jgi:hypothetical protein
MSKTKISDYASTATGAGLNTDIAGINIDEGCAPSGINNAIRTLMAQVKDLQSGASGDTLPVAAGGTGSANTTTARTNLGAAASGSNSDITSLNALTTPISLIQGGTGALRASITFVSRASNVASITTGTAHGFTAGDEVTLSGITTAGFNAVNVTLASVPTTTTFTYPNTGSNVTSTADSTGTVIDLTSIQNNIGMNIGTIVAGVATSQGYTAQQYFVNATLTDGANIDWNLSTQQVATVTLGGNRTFNAPTNLVNGGYYGLSIVQDGTGSRTITWNSVFKWASGTAPTLSTAASAKDFFVFRSDGTNLYEQGRSLGVA